MIFTSGGHSGYYRSYKLCEKMVCNRFNSSNDVYATWNPYKVKQRLNEAK